MKANTSPILFSRQGQTPAPRTPNPAVDLGAELSSRVAMCQEVSDHLAAALPKLRPQQSQQLRAAGLLDKASSLICKASDTLEGQA